MHPISEVLFSVYEELHNRGQIAFPLTQKNKEKIDSVVKTVNANYFGVYVYKTSYERACAYFYLILKNHPVADGNKRLSVLWFQLYCDTKSLKPDYTIYSLDELAVSVINSKPEEKEDILLLLNDLLFGSNKGNISEDK